MLGSGAEWYLSNRSKIVTFQKWIEQIETDILPTKIAELIRSAALDATSQLELDRRHN